MAAPRFSSAGNSMEGNVSENGYSDPPQQQQGGYYGGQNSAAQQNQQNAGYYQQTDKDYPQQQTINPGYNQGYNQNDYGPDHGNFQGNFQGFGQGWFELRYLMSLELNLNELNDVIYGIFNILSVVTKIEFE